MYLLFELASLMSSFKFCECCRLLSTTICWYQFHP